MYEHGKRTLDVRANNFIGEGRRYPAVTRKSIERTLRTDEPSGEERTITVRLQLTTQNERADVRSTSRPRHHPNVRRAGSNPIRITRPVTHWTRIHDCCDSGPRIELAWPTPA